MEAVTIGLMNMALFYALSQVSTGLTTPWLLFISGALIHIMFEFAGLNEWWCRQTYKN
jgi:hypothetical protein